MAAVGGWDDGDPRSPASPAGSSMSISGEGEGRCPDWPSAGLMPTAPDFDCAALGWSGPCASSAVGPSSPPPGSRWATTLATARGPQGGPTDAAAAPAALPVSLSDWLPGERLACAPAANGADLGPCVEEGASCTGDGWVGVPGSAGRCWQERRRGWFSRRCCWPPLPVLPLLAALLLPEVFLLASAGRLELAGATAAGVVLAALRPFLGAAASSE
jgi:hypothetical protein